MKRREFITLLGSAAAYPATGWGQEAKLPTIPRIGCLVFGSAAASASRVEVLGAALRELGYVEGKNIVMETMWAESGRPRKEVFASEPARIKPPVV